jgi:hypothetical protein
MSSTEWSSRSHQEDGASAKVIPTMSAPALVMPPTVVMEHFAERYDIDYLILDLAYVTPERLHIFDWVTAL